MISRNRYCYLRCLQSAVCLHFGENVNSSKSNNYFPFSCSFNAYVKFIFQLCMFTISCLFTFCAVCFHYQKVTIFFHFHAALMNTSNSYFDLACLQSAVCLQFVLFVYILSFKYNELWWILQNLLFVNGFLVICSTDCKKF